MRAEVRRYTDHPEMFACHVAPEGLYGQRALRFGYIKECLWMEEVTLRGITMEDCTVLIQALTAYRIAELEAQNEALAVEAALEEAIG